VNYKNINILAQQNIELVHLFLQNCNHTLSVIILLACIILMLKHEYVAVNRETAKLIYILA